jgi:hypothetical protein
MKQVTTFAASEAVAAISFYNVIAQNFDIPEITLKDVAKAAFTKNDKFEQVSMSVDLMGNITITSELDAVKVTKFLTIVTKHLVPFIAVVKAVIALIVTLKPVMKALEHELVSELEYDGASKVECWSVYGEISNMYHARLAPKEDSRDDVDCKAVAKDLTLAEFKDVSAEAENFLVIYKRDEEGKMRLFISVK